MAAEHIQRIKVESTDSFPVSLDQWKKNCFVTDSRSQLKLLIHSAFFLIWLSNISNDPSCSPPFLTLRLLEAVAPLVVGQFAVLEGVAGVEERLHAQLILVQVDGAQFRLVQQQVKVHVQLVKHPAEWVLANGQDTRVKVCGRRREKRNEK